MNGIIIIIILFVLLIEPISMIFDLFFDIFPISNSRSTSIPIENPLLKKEEANKGYNTISVKPSQSNENQSIKEEIKKDQEGIVSKKEKEFVNYDISQYVNSENYPVFKSPIKGVGIRSYRCGKAKRRGYKEQEFQSSIEKYFGHFFEVLGDARLNIKKGIMPFEPDIAIIGKDIYKNIYIDIEIDEPYSGVSRELIHCKGQDETRNGYFTGKGWVVVRFSEYQVHTQELECLKYLAGIIKLIVPTYTIPVQLKNIADLEKECLWDTIQASKWEKEKYREKYLGINRFYIVENDIEQGCNEEELEEEEPVVSTIVDVMQKDSIKTRENKEIKHTQEEKSIINQIPTDIEIGTNDVNKIKTYIEFAIKSSVNIKFNYRNSNGIKSLRTLEPIKFESPDSLCLIGFCYLTQDPERKFRIDRMTNIIINPSKIEDWREECDTYKIIL